jgi:hypothetical protein
LYPFIIGLIAGILSTAAMTMTEIPSWKKWGIYGVFEWHENYIIIKRLYLLFSNTIEKERQSYFKGAADLLPINGIPKLVIINENAAAHCRECLIKNPSRKLGNFLMIHTHASIFQFEEYKSLSNLTCEYF